MTSTVSFKDKLKQAFSFFQWELKSCAGTLTIYSVLTAVFMIIILTMCLVIGAQAEANNINGLYITESFAFSNTMLSDLTGVEDYSALTLAKAVFQLLSFDMVQLMTVIFTVVYTVKVFGYLHNKRQTDMYGSMPVSRITLFFSKSATAFVFSVVPATVFLGIITIISVILGLPLLNYALMSLAMMVMGSLACISAYGLIAVCCGTTINSILMFIAVSIAYPMSAHLVIGVIDSFFIGSSTEYLNNSFIMNAFCPISAYNGKNIIYWLIFTVVCLAASAYLVKNRKAERAQTSFAYYLPCHIVKVLVSFIAGMFFGVLFGSLNVFGNGYAGFVFGFILASIPAFIVCHLIFYHGFQKLLKTSVILGALFVVTAGSMALISFDIIGYNKYIPNVDEIESAGFIRGENCYYNPDEISFSKLLENASTDFDDEKRISNTVSIHKNTLERNNNHTLSEKYTAALGCTLESVFKIGRTEYEAYSYKLKDGSVITRKYDTSDFDSMYDSALATDDNDTSIQTMMEEIVCTKEYQEKYSAFMNADCHEIRIMSIYDVLLDLNAPSSYCEYSITDDENKSCIEDMEKIIEAYKKDFEANPDDIDEALYYTLSGDAVCFGGQSDLRKPEVYEEDYSDFICILEINYLSDSTLFGIDEHLVVPSSYTNTIQALKDAGILNADGTAAEDTPYFNFSNAYSYDDSSDTVQ